MGKQHRIALDLIWLGKAMRQYVGRGCDTGGKRKLAARPRPRRSA